MIEGYGTAVRLEFHHMVKFRTDTCPWCIHMITLPIVSKLDSHRQLSNYPIMQYRGWPNAFRMINIACQGSWGILLSFLMLFGRHYIFLASKETREQFCGFRAVFFISMYYKDLKRIRKIEPLAHSLPLSALGIFSSTKSIRVKRSENSLFIRLKGTRSAWNRLLFTFLYETVAL